MAAQRLTGLLDYVEALVKLDERVATRLSQHKLADGSQFILHQHELAGLPGIKDDFADNDGPIWLRVQRLQRSTPPEIEKDCAEWIDISNDPTRVPEIRETVHHRLPEAEQQRLVAEGKARAEDCIRSLKVDKSDPPHETFYDVMLRLEDRPELRATLEAYCARAMGALVRAGEAAPALDRYLPASLRNRAALAPIRRHGIHRTRLGHWAVALEAVRASLSICR